MRTSGCGVDARPGLEPKHASTCDQLRNGWWRSTMQPPGDRDPEETSGTDARTGLTGGRRTDKIGLTVGFAVAGVLVILYAARTSPVLSIPTTAQFGLLQVLPPLYWLGLGLLALSLALAARSHRDLLFVIAGAVLLGIFAATPGLFEPNPPVWDAYAHYAAAEGMIRIGRIPTDPAAYAANWPGFFLITASAGLLGGLQPLEFLGIF